MLLWGSRDEIGSLLLSGRVGYDEAVILELLGLLIVADDDKNED